MTWLYGIGVSPGRSRPIEEAAEADQGKALMALKADGFRDFVDSDLALPDLAAAAITRSLAATATDPAAVDAVLLATESFWDSEIPELQESFQEHLRLRHGLLAMLGRLGLVNAYPYGSWMSACANLGASLALARGLIAAGQHRRILVVLADKLAPGVPRIMHNDAAVWSDLAACCLLGPEEQGFKLRHVVSVAAPRAAAHDFLKKENLPKILHETLRALKRLDASFAAATGRRVRDHECFIGGHFHRFSLKIIADALGIPEAKLHRDARAEFAHGYAADTLLTLAKLEGEGRFEPGQEIVLFNSSVWAWSLAVLEKVG